MFRRSFFNAFHAGFLYNELLVRGALDKAPSELDNGVGGAQEVESSSRGCPERGEESRVGIPGVQIEDKVLGWKLKGKARQKTW